MVREAGFKTHEDDVPTWRKPLPGAPNFPQILAGEDGVWLAALALDKLEMEAWRVVNTNSLLLVAPDQPGARLFVGRISDLEPSCQVVLLPDSVIRRFQESPKAELSEEEKRSEWGSQLRGASNHSRPIICEEFSVSGGTATGISRLLSSLGKAPVVHLVIVDFRPIMEKPISRRTALYAFETQTVYPVARVLFGDLQED